MATLFFRFPRLTVLTLFLVVVAGAAALAVVGRQEDPSLTERFGNVIVPFPGADAARVEALVTDPIEAELMELVEVEEVQSISRANIALIDVSVREDLDMAEVEQAWTKIRDAVSSVAGRLPDGAGPAEVDRFYMGAATLMVALRGSARSPDCRTSWPTGCARWTARMKPRSSARRRKRCASPSIPRRPQPLG
ncbi:MAG: efflux RND transporter permease subunit [Oceanicaulis sp.]